MSKPTVTRSKLIPFPSGGVNARDPSRFSLDNEATNLTNCYLLTQGLRPRGRIVSDTGLNSSSGVQSLFVAPSASADGNLLAFGNNKLFYQTTPGGAWTDTGVTTGNDVANCFIFANRTFICNAFGRVTTVSTAMAVATAGFTFPGPVNDSGLVQGWAYNGRPYFILGGSQTFYYSPTIGGVTGNLNSVDLSSVMNYGGDLLFGTDWTFNQGLQTQTLNVFVSYRGEVLIYSGGSPITTDWQLIARLKIPTPMGRRAFYKLGNELYIETTLGVIPLTQALQSGSISNTYYSISDKVGTTVFQTLASPKMAECDSYPILFVPVYGALLGLNYQLGSWFILCTYAPFTDADDIAVWKGKVFFCGLGTGTNSIQYTGFADSPATTNDWDGQEPFMVWTSNEMSMDAPTVIKTTKMVRVAGDIVGMSATVQGIGDSRFGAESKATSTTKEIEVVPVATGRWVQYIIKSNAQSLQSNFVSAEIFYELGGLY